MTMVTLENCLVHLKELERTDTAILGIEGFVLVDGKRKPNLDAIADFSSLNNADWPVFRSKSHEAAENFINAMVVDKTCDVFEFTVFERADHTSD